WHWSWAPHTTGFEPLQAPAWQVSVCVHRLPSSQVEPSTLGWATQASAVSSHTPSLHWSAMAEQSRGDPWQVPPWQVSFTVQKAPSSQGAVLATCWHTPPALHWSSVQALLSEAHAVPARSNLQVEVQQSPF